MPQRDAHVGCHRCFDLKPTWFRPIASLIGHCSCAALYSHHDQICALRWLTAPVGVISGATPRERWAV
eukprot:7376152-Prymnesium_polylepis.1